MTQTQTQAPTLAPEVGDFLVETLVTDTVAYEVVGVTAKTLLLLPAHQGERIETGDGPYPVVLTEIVPLPVAHRVKENAITVRLRKDGTYRVGTHRLRPAPRKDGVPFTRTDYSF